MAIPFLNNINLSDNELQNAKLHVTSTAPTAAAAQVYFDSTPSDLTAKYYSNSTDLWVSLKEYSFPTGTYVTGAVTGTTPKPIITFDLNAVDGVAGSGERYLTKSNTWAEVSGISGTTYDLDSIQVGSDVAITLVGSDATVDTVTLVAGTNITLTDDGSANITIDSTDQFQGTLTGITEGPGITVTPSATSPTVEVDYLGPDNYIVNRPTDVADSDDSIPFNKNNDSDTVKETTFGTIPVEALTLVKNYIDNSISGGVYYQGGYNPVTDLTSPGNYGLQTPPSPNIIEIGWMYTVTADGTFFGEQVRVGDVLIAEIDAPTSLSDWTTVQNNIDLATSLVVGLGNVVPGSSDTITAPYSSGTATLDVVDSTPTQKGAVIVDAGTGVSVSYTSGTATVTNTDTNSSNTFAGDIGNGSATSIRLENSGAIAPNINHGLGTDSTAFMIQLVDNATGETVYADVSRSAGGQVTIDFATPPALDAIKVLIQKIG